MREERAATPDNGLRLLALAPCVVSVCVLACVVPTERGTRVEPTEALESDR